MHLDGFHTCARHFSLGHEILLCTFRPLPLPFQVEILHLEGFKTCAKHVPPGPQTLPCSFSLLPALCHRPLPLPCQVEILHLEKVSKSARSTFYQGPKTVRAALALCQCFARSNIAFKRFPHLRQARFTRTRNHPVHLSPFAATLLARSKFCI